MRYIDGRIIYVDTTRKIFDAITWDGNNYIKDIQYVKNSGLLESGDIYHPEIGDGVVIELLEDGQARLDRLYASRQISSDGLTSFAVGGDAAALPGDRNFKAPGGAFLSLLRGKMAAVGGGPLAQTIYVGIENLIRTICSNYEAIGSGFRVFSVNDNGKIITRLCFTSQDQFAVTGYNENEEASSENFEYQIDMTSDGFTFFIGELDEITKKRKNNFVVSISQSGDILGTCGENIQFSMFSTGAFSFKILNADSKIIYNKSVALSEDSVLVKEIVNGDYIRKINGNLFESITGSHNKKCDTNILVSQVNDITTGINKVSASINSKDLEPAPSAEFRTS